jgi:hypothetical protein
VYGRGFAAGSAFANARTRAAAGLAALVGAALWMRSRQT